MKKFILITIVCFLIPCSGFAQEPDGRDTLDGTIWEATMVFGNLRYIGTTYNIGFKEGHVYKSSTERVLEPIALSSYVDTPVVGTFFALDITPIGFGTMCGTTYPSGKGCMSATGILFQPPYLWVEGSKLIKTDLRLDF